MKDYLNEINDCRMLITKLKAELDQLNRRLDTIYMNYWELFLTDRESIADSALLHMKDKMYERYERLYSMKCETEARYLNARDALDELRREYRQQQARDYYRPMDNIDIFEIIHNDGFIVGVKL